MGRRPHSNHHTTSLPSHGHKIKVLSLFLTGLDFLPRINGHPGKSTRLAGLWKLEEVSLP